MKFKEFIFPFLGKVCAACVGLALLFYTALTLLSLGSLEGTRGIPFSQFALLLLCALLLTAASYLLRLQLPRLLCVVLHYFACFFSLFLTFLIAGNLVVISPTSILVFLFLFSALYGLYWGIFSLARFLLFPEKRREKTKKEKQKEEEYVPRF